MGSILQWSYYIVNLSLTMNYFADEEAERKKKKKARALVEQVGRALLPQSKFRSESIEIVKKTSNAFAKQSAQSNGQFLLKDNLARDQKEVPPFSILFIFFGSWKKQGRQQLYSCLNSLLEM